MMPAAIPESEPVGVANEEEDEEGVSLMQKTLTCLTDNEETLAVQAATLDQANTDAERAGAARHATICVFERVYQATQRKLENLRALREARERFEQRPEDGGGDILEFVGVLDKVVHVSVPTAPTHGVHPQHAIVVAARAQIGEAQERYAADVCAFAKTTESCDEIEAKIAYGVRVGVTRENPAIVEAQQVANSLRENERLAQRKKNREAYKSKLQSQESMA